MTRRGRGSCKIPRWCCWTCARIPSGSAGHAAEALHLGKGVLERDLEKLIPDVNTEIIMYCGGGFRSALTCDVAQKMGYRNVHSLIGGYKAMVQPAGR